MAAHELGFAIVGAEMIAHKHAAAIAQTPGARLVAVSRSDTARCREAAAQFGVPCETDYQALLARSDVDVVCICTPSGMHAQQAIDAARAGKHILVEKPMALALADADAMIAACDAAGVQLAVAFQRRTSPSFDAIPAAIAAGDLGRLTLGSVTLPYYRPQSYYDSAAWRGTWALDGGGALMNQGIHLVDLLLWFMGDVVEVQAASATLSHRIEVEDCVAATLRFANGALGSVVATTAAAPGFPHRVEVYGDGGSVQIEGDRIVRWEGGKARALLASRQDEAAPMAGNAGADPAAIGAEAHARLIGDLVAAIREGRPPLVSGREGRRSLALVLAIYEAARSGGRVTLDK